MKSVLFPILVGFIAYVLFLVGWNAGKYHVLIDSQIYVENETVFIELDGDLFAHNLD